VFAKCLLCAYLVVFYQVLLGVTMFVLGLYKVLLGFTKFVFGFSSVFMRCY